MDRQPHGTVSMDSMQDALDFYNHVPPTDTHAAYDMEHALDHTLDHNLDPNDSLPLRSPSASPTRAANRSISSPVPTALPSLDSSASLSSVRAQQRSIKDLVNRFNQTSTLTVDSHIPIPAANERHRRPSETRAKLQKQPRSPTKARMSSAPHVKLYASRGISDGLAAVAAPHMAMSGLSAAQPPARKTSRRRLHKPLFGEVIHDENLHLMPGFGISSEHNRRGSEGSLRMASSKEHKRSRSEAHLLPPRQEAPEGYHLTVGTSEATHKRSTSDITHDPEQAATYPRTSPRLLTSAFSDHHRSSSPVLSSPDRPSRIPVSSTRLGTNGQPTSPTHRRVSSKNHFPAPASPNHKSPSKTSHLPTLTGRRYDPFSSRQAQPSQSLKAFIKTDPPQKSPPLRSSRPRQHVSAATTSASRAKAGQRFESAILNKDGRTSDQAKYRSKKTIPELGRVDFAERRARIQRAISANLPDDTRSDQSSMSARSSMSGAGRYSVGESDVIGHEESSDEAITNGHHHHRKTSTAAASGLGLSLEVNGKPLEPSHGAPYSRADTSFDLSPTLASDTEVKQSHDEERAPTNDTAGQSPDEPVTLLSQVMRMRERSTSSASRTDIESSPNFSGLPSPNASEVDEKGSIRIMLDGSSPAQAATPEWPLEPATARQEHFPPEPPTAKQEHFPSPNNALLESEDESYDSDRVEVGSSPWVGADSPGVPETPRKDQHLNPDHYVEDNDITPRQTSRVGRSSMMAISSQDWNRDSDAYSAVNHILEQYRVSGDLTPEMLYDFERHVSMLSPNLNNTRGSDAATIKVLLDHLLADQYALSKQKQQVPAESPYPATTLYSPAESRLMDSPEEEFRPGTAIIFSPPNNHSFEEEKRDTHIEQSLPSQFSPSSLAVNTPASRFDSYADAISGADEDDFRPPPPPKDEGYSPRASNGHRIYQALDEMVPVSARQSRTSMSLPASARQSRSIEPLRLPDIPTGQGLGLAISVEPPSTTATAPPPLPMYSPPPPPPPSDTVKQLELAFAGMSGPVIAASVPTSPTVSRPSTAEERYRNFSTPAQTATEPRRKPEPLSLPPSHSMTSFQSSDRGPSLDDSATTSTQPPTPNPEVKRLLKRKHIIKELVDTEYSYHQDMKIIEDIYKGTVGDMITADDKKVLFGNSDQVEGFSLEFYDSLRRAVTDVYVPPKSSRWQNKRGSFSTSNSGERESISDLPEEDRDATTRVGEVFAHFLTQMEKVYGAYLKNHDAANQRLAKLQCDATVKCWLAECHNNASDITSAWDLDSLLVKPVQRILKYPLLLQQLVESTPAAHPDHKALEYSVKEIMNVTHRINEAKKRADLVEQMVTRKRKESDVRSGLAKAFGRRTEKFKERVGIAEAYQDAEFDELAHKFGGHFIRLQVCMRDVQGSIAEVDKAVHHFLEFANALEAYVEVSPSTSPEIESKWRKFILAIRELATVAMPDHKLKVQNHVIKPMLTAIELHKGPQNAIQKRKKRILDYAKCKTMEKAGQKPDKKIADASEMYEALNEQLKIDLPRLYSLTADLIKACLDSNVVLQTNWMWLWKEKLAPVLEYTPRPDEPESREMTFPENIVPSFIADYDIVHSHIIGLSICNGSLLADASNFLSPQTTLVGDESVRASRATSRTRRPSDMSGGRSGLRKLSVGSESSPYLVSPDLEKSFNLPLSPNLTSFPNGQPGFYGRMRSSSSLSASRGRTPTIPQGSSSNTLPNSRMPSLTSKSSFTATRPATANVRPTDHFQHSISRMSVETLNKDMRPASGTSYFTAAQDRFSGMFSSAMPMSDSPTSGTAPASPKHAQDDTPVMFVAASLFEFNIDRARREAGYPYLTYVEGEVFDVVAQKGELWLAKNQDDQTNSLGWIWEQHFVILSQDA